MGSFLSKFKYAWEIEPSSYGMLSIPRRDGLLNNFTGFLRTIDEGKSVLIRVTCKQSTFQVDSERYPLLITNFYIYANERLDVTSSFDVKNGGNPLPPDLRESIDERPRVIRPYSKYVALEDGMYARTLTLYRLGFSVPEAILSTYFPAVDEIYLKLTAISPAQAASYLSGAVKRIGEYLEQNPDPMIKGKYERLKEMLDKASFDLRMYEMKLWFVVKLNDPKNLLDFTNRIMKRARAQGLYLDAPRFIQDRLYNGDLSMVRALVLDEESIKVFYPFISDEIRDKDGIFLGVNPSNNHPIIYNPYARENYNIVILGESGSGKSFTTKVFIRRFMRKHPNAMLYVIDPEAEYSSVAPYLAKNINVVTIRPDQPLGLDPIRWANMYPNIISKEIVANVLFDLYKLPEDIKHYFIADVMRAEDIFHLYEIADPIYKDRIKFLVREPEVNLFKGQPVRFTDRMIFDISSVGNNKYLKAKIMTLLTPFIMAPLFNPRNRSRPKLFVVDEAWLLSDLPTAMFLFENVARRGRKWGVVFAFVTQNPEDVVKNEAGATIVKNAATAILLKQEEEGIKALRPLFDLSESEVNKLLSLTEKQKGEGIFKASSKRVEIKVQPTSEELRVFNTNAVQVGRTKS